MVRQFAPAPLLPTRPRAPAVRQWLVRHQASLVLLSGATTIVGAREEVVEQLRELELERHRAWLMSLAPGERERIEALTRGLVWLPLE